MQIQRSLNAIWFFSVLVAGRVISRSIFRTRNKYLTHTKYILLIHISAIVPKKEEKNLFIIKSSDIRPVPKQKVNWFAVTKTKTTDRKKRNGDKHERDCIRFEIEIFRVSFYEFSYDKNEMK